ncbi:glutathione hydrolase 1 proenzyme-like [Saccoglossus kowalevskii]|uniref:Gamma-glutamyltranspeptidase 1-like n=1 Tax=Saccoglossus kowalevskii TaxID=10224 RepID=A0ABM0GLU7_SACKO|nr:PREDICTED: gamma-glutamyltranspeptidase 1-like [Saccoglossus kowalevskii]
MTRDRRTLDAMASAHETTEETEKSPLLSSRESSGEYTSSYTSTTKATVSKRYVVILSIIVLVIVAVVSVIVALSIYHNLFENHGAVSSGARQCTELGVETLKNGGHAVDAAITTILCLGLVNAQSSGIAGGGFMLVKEGESDVAVLDFREVAPLDAHMYRKKIEQDADLAFTGALAVAVPSEIRGLELAWRRYGRLEWFDLFEPVIRLARNGFEVTGSTAKAVVKELDGRMMYSERLRNIYMPNGTRVKEGDTLKRPDLAAVLETIATEGADAMFNGRLSKEMIDTVLEAGGNLTAQDFLNYQPIWRTPLKTTYHAATVYTLGAPSGGPVVLSILGILEGYDLTSGAMKDPLTYHRLIEAFKFAFAQKTRLGDPDFVPDVRNLTQIMTSKESAAELRAMINDSSTYPSEYYGPYLPKPGYGTSHACVIDNEGNMVSITSSVNERFGSGLMTPSGILLNNHMNDFSWSDGSNITESTSNFIEPGKRPQSSIAPLLSRRLLDAGISELILGGNGGTAIGTGIAQVYLDIISYGLSLEESVNKRRVDRTSTDFKIEVEERIADNVVEGLLDRGHIVEMVDDIGSQVMAARRQNYALEAASDPRKLGSSAVVF